MGKISIACFMWMGVSVSAMAQFTEVASVQDAGGGSLSNAQYRGLSVICPGMPLGYTATAVRLNHGGFLHGDANAPAVTQDTDGDELQDWVELTGEANNPVTASSTTLADTDGDTLTDSDEARAGTNPLDDSSALRIISLRHDGSDLVVRWASREGYTYEVLRLDSMRTSPDSGTLLGTLSATGGVGPWFETVSSLTNSPIGQTEFYLIRLKD